MDILSCCIFIIVFKFFILSIFSLPVLDLSVILKSIKLKSPKVEISPKKEISWYTSVIVNNDSSNKSLFLFLESNSNVHLASFDLPLLTNSL